MPFLVKNFSLKRLGLFHWVFISLYFSSFIFLSPVFSDKQETYTPDFSEAFGKVNGSFKGKSGKTVLLVQDAHCNFEAQRNTSEILNSLSQTKAIPLIGLEGAQGEFEEDLFASDPNRQAVQEITYSFLKDAWLTGPEFFVINSDLAKGTELLGVESRDLYFKNLEAFRNAYRSFQKFEPAFQALQENLDQLKEKVYSKKMFELDRILQSYERGEILFQPYFSSLMDFAESVGHKVDPQSVVAEQQNVFMLEKQLDFELLEKQRADLINQLSKDLAPEISGQLLSQTLLFKTNRLSAWKYYGFLFRLSKDRNIDLKNFPQVAIYHNYIYHVKEILEPELFEKIEGLTNGLKEKLLQSAQEKELNEIDVKVGLITRLCHFRISNSEFEYFQKHSDEFEWDKIVSPLAKIADDRQVPLVFPEDLKNLEGVTSLFKAFYEFALQRDEAMLNASLQGMEEKKVSLMMLVTGGFHTQGIAQALKEKDISFFIITPKVIQKNVPIPYFSILMNELSPLDQWLSQGSALAVQVPLVTAKDSMSDGRRRSMRELFAILRMTLEPFYQKGQALLTLQLALLKAYQDLASLREKLGAEQVWISPPRLKVENGITYVEMPISYEVKGEDGKVSRRESVVILSQGEKAPANIQARAASRGLVPTRVNGGDVTGSMDSSEGIIAFSAFETPQNVSNAQTALRNQWLIAALKNLSVEVDGDKAQVLFDRLASSDVTIESLGKVLADLEITFALDDLNQAKRMVDALYTAAVSVSDFEIAARLYGDLKIRFKDQLAVNPEVGIDVRNKERVATSARLTLEEKGASIASLYEKDFTEPMAIGLLTNLLFESVTVENGSVQAKPSVQAGEVIATIKNLIARVRGTPAEQTLKLALISLDESVPASAYAQVRQNILNLFGLPGDAALFVGVNDVISEKKAEENILDTLSRAIAEKVKIDAKNIVLFVESKEKLAGRLAKHLAFVIEQGQLGEATSFTEAVVIVNEVKSLVGTGEKFEPPQELVDALEKNLARTGMTREKIVGALKGVAVEGHMDLPPQPSMDASQELNALGGMEDEVLGQSA